MLTKLQPPAPHMAAEQALPGLHALAQALQHQYCCTWEGEEDPEAEERGRPGKDKVMKSLIWVSRDTEVYVPSYATTCTTSGNLLHHSVQPNHLINAPRGPDLG